MPMIDVLIPEGSLTAQAGATLMTELTDLLIRAEAAIRRIRVCAT